MLDEVVRSNDPWKRLAFLRDKTYCVKPQNEERDLDANLESPPAALTFKIQNENCFPFNVSIYGLIFFLQTQAPD